MSGIIDTSFVRKDFYIKPPAKDASPEEWAEWVKADSNKARAAKAAFTRASKAMPAELPEALTQGIVTKVNGVYRQSTLVGFTGSAEEGTLGVDVVDPRANPHRDLALMQMESERHEGSSKSKHRKARNRRHQRAIRFAKRGQQ